VNDAAARSELVRALDATGRRRSRAVGVSGAVELIATIALAGGVLLGLDRWLEPAVEIRALLGGVAIGLIAWTARRGWARLRRRPTRDDLARGLAVVAGDRAELLRTAADLLVHPDPRESALLRSLVVAEAEATVRRSRPGPPPLASGARSLAFLILGLAPLTALWMLDPESARIGLARTAWLASTRYPARTRMHLVLDDPSRESIQVVRGADLRLTAVALGEPVTEAILHRLTGGGRVRQTMRPDGTGRFVTVLHRLTAPETVYVTGGDDRDERPAYRVDVIDPPRVAHLRVREHFPSYTGRTEARLHQGPALRLLEGSRITLLVTTNHPVRSAHLRLGHRDPIPMERLGPTRYRSSVDPSGHRDYSVLLVDARGLENRPAPIHPIRFYPDRPPDVRLEAPSVTGPITARARFEVRARGEDDFGIVRAMNQLHPVGRPEDGETVPIAVERPPEIVGVLDLERARIASPTGRRRPEPGDRLTFRVVAGDALGQTGRSTGLTLVVATETEVEHELLTRVLDAAHTLEAVADRLEHTARRLAAFALRHGDPARVPRRGEDEARRTEIRIEEEHAGLRSVASRLAEIVRGYEENRLASGPDSVRALRLSRQNVVGAGRILERDATGALRSFRAAITGNQDGAAALRELRIPVELAAERCRTAIRSLATFATFREVLRHAESALRAHEEVHRLLLDILEHAAAGRRVHHLLDAGTTGIRAVEREIDLLGRGLDALLNRPLERPGVDPVSLRRWRDRIEEAGLMGLARQVDQCLSSRRPGNGLSASRELLAHLRALLAELVRLSGAERAARPGRPNGEPGQLDPERLKELLAKAEALKSDLERSRKAIEPSDLSDALKKLVKKANQLGRDLGRAEPPVESEEKTARVAHPESLRRLVKQIRQSLEKGRTEGAIQLTEDLLGRLRRSLRRRAARPIDPRTEAARQDRPPDPRGQNLTGEYRPSPTGPAGPDAGSLPAVRPDRGAALRWGDLAPARGGGSFTDVPKDLPGGYRRALERYYLKLGEAR